jgi:hypothetical protein
VKARSAESTKQGGSNYTGLAQGRNGGNKEGSKAAKKLKPKKKEKELKYDSCCIAKCADIAANPKSIYSPLAVCALATLGRRIFQSNKHIAWP